MFCSNCGNNLPDGAAFCPTCGMPVVRGDCGSPGNASVAPVMNNIDNQNQPMYNQMTPNLQGDIQGIQNAGMSSSGAMGQPIDNGQPVGAQFFGPVPRRNMLYRFRCPKCGTVQNVYPNGVCSKCGAPADINFDRMGFIQIYRMGHFSGSINGQGIYINNQPTGHIGNKETIVIALEPGTYRIHLAIGLTRNCNDRVLNVRPGEIIYLKSQLRQGMWKSRIDLVDADPGSFPPVPCR